jgi:adenylate cyclase class 2
MSGAVVEHELKIPVPELERVRQALSEEGGRRTHGGLHEDNLLMDTGSGELRTAGRVLRIRRFGGETILTLKGGASFRRGVKSRTEDEVVIDDGDRMLAILSGLGFEVVARYQKVREGWHLGPVKVLLDRTPMGSFVEIEGPFDQLEATAQRLGLDPESAVRGSYLDLWHDHRAAHPGNDLPDDMVFPE